MCVLWVRYDDDDDIIVQQVNEQRYQVWHEEEPHAML